MIRAALVVALAGAAACVPSRGWVLAQGAAAELPRDVHGCRVTSPEGIIALRDGVVRADRPGRGELACAGARLVYEVRPVARLTIDGPASARLHEKVYFSLKAWDAAGRELWLGDASGVTWQVSPGLHEGSLCNHMLGTCLRAWQRPVIVDQPGSHQVTARFQGASAARALDVPAP
jgi:hypothetical protein